MRYAKNYQRDKKNKREQHQKPKLSPRGKCAPQKSLECFEKVQQRNSQNKPMSLVNSFRRHGDTKLGARKILDHN